ncbi:hypothetical protein SAMN04490179_2783 [Pseudomonas antarctica]|uniref:Uncharacterized protein n=1 Tax=Pseudomonas antarctica TaxID=219572 RepID=A0A1G9Z1T1_9PSED|nr:hypothetical protein [Pseudomonas antarctica]KAF2410925.1 hypothetical protein PSAN_33590 [Pseudomonas antarctica]SDN14865.1 hypothetical protein SAMN04490179_2783 [Pseudomonas antarctica]
MGSTPKLEIEGTAYDDFLNRWNQGAFEQQRLGQAFYNHFQLHTLNDQASICALHGSDGEKAKAAILRLFEIK